MEQITLGEILRAVDGTLLGSFDDLTAVVNRVETDSRTIHPGSLFIPLVGERFDGHAYINSALEAGASGCFTARERESYRSDKFYIKVASPLRALRDLAAWYRTKFPIPLIGITGSVGKTTTKDMVASVLGTKYKVLKTEGNMNSREGMPLTLLRLDRRHEIAVIEMGMSQAGEIDYLSSIACPDVGVITNVGDAHVENLGSRENILKAKCEIFNHLKDGGLAVLNADDELLKNLRPSESFRTLFFGQEESAHYRAQEIRSDENGRIACRICTAEHSFEAEIPGVGRHMVYPALIAAAIGEHFGLTTDEISQGLLEFEPTKMRMNVLHRAGGITILNDTYNANPQSMRAAIGVLGDNKSEWKVAVLGDMFELGSLAPALHASVGEYLGRVGIDCLIAVGALTSEHMASAAERAGVPTVYRCADKGAAIPVIKDIVRPNGTFLFKASRGMALEELVDYICQITEEE